MASTLFTELITTILKRPYVFLFLIAYLLLAWRLWGWRRTLLWLVTGYGIAWLSEYSSIHNGFPYGEYHYRYENLQGELLVFGVPFFDSLSYPFLIFAGYTLALFLTTASLSARPSCAPATNLAGADEGHHSGLLHTEKVKGSRKCFEIIFCSLGAFFTMLLDIIIDPVATMGEKWFLGQIHYYVNPGKYFGVPLSNFAGWFLVAFVVILTNQMIWRALPSLTQKRAQLNWLYPAFFFSIALFNISIAFWISAWELALISSGFLVLLVLFMQAFFLKKRTISASYRRDSV
ncbi:MAG: hypothetical protein A3I05_03545 [Deltaproteobacteria bacterium RIFCSPLOWO2_02_FULL_44_10]|nr:MAG: hypothetical protein A3C46_03120 [Deltaproteobacteria bacterium RIFCSPHIGHO2_02_FULL_44_16]OGQ46245.1 MAG: hypothetical protein A3I05_03545 [Deltaproteobacteria bacterium RIFCSPLOWO2_02_FULL_44_10]